MDKQERPKPKCPCCGKELYRLMMPGPVAQQIARMAMEDSSDITELLLILFEIMHNSVGLQSTKLTPEDREEMRRDMERN